MRALVTAGGAVAGGALGYSAGRMLTPAGGYTRVPLQEIEMASQDIETGVVEVGSRAPRPPGMRYRTPRADPRAVEEFGEEAEREASRLQRASQRARDLFRSLRTQTSGEYEAASTAEDAEIELQEIVYQSGIEGASAEEVAAESAAAQASFEAEIELEEFTAITSEAAPELVVMPEAAVGLTELSAAEASALLGEEAMAEGGVVMAESLGLAGAEAVAAGEAGVAGGEVLAAGGEIELAELGLAETAAAVDVGAEVGGAVATAEAVAAPFDAETFGLAAVAAGVIGATVGGLAAFFGSQHKQHHGPKPGIQQLQGDDLDRARASSDASKRTIDAAQKAGQPIYVVTTNSKKGLIVAQLSPESLARTQAALTADPTLMKGHDPHVLEAMGLNPSLATQPYASGSSPFAQRIPPVPPETLKSAATALADRGQRRLAQEQVTLNEKRIAQVSDPAAKAYLQAQLRHFKWHNGLITGDEPQVPSPPSTPESEAALRVYNERVAEARAANTKAQLDLKSAQQTVDGARANVATTTAQAQQDYAALVSRINTKRRLQVSEYNTQVLSGLHSIADQYSADVAAQNLRIAQQSRGPTRLLGTNIQAAMQAAQLSYQPLSTQLQQTKQQQEIAAAKRVGLANPTAQAYRQLKTSLPSAASKPQIAAAVAQSNNNVSISNKA